MALLLEIHMRRKMCAVQHDERTAELLLTTFEVHISILIKSIAWRQETWITIINMAQGRARSINYILQISLSSACVIVNSDQVRRPQNYKWAENINMATLSHQTSRKLLNTQTNKETNKHVEYLIPHRVCIYKYMAPTAGILGAERVLQRLRGVCGQYDAADK